MEVHQPMQNRQELGPLHVRYGRCLLIKDIFSPVCSYAGNVDLNTAY